MNEIKVNLRFLEEVTSELGSLDSILEEEQNLLQTIENLKKIIMDAETTINRRVDTSVYKEFEIRILHLEITKVKKVLMLLMRKGSL